MDNWAWFSASSTPTRFRHPCLPRASANICPLKPRLHFRGGAPLNKLHEGYARFLPISLRLRNNLFWIRAVLRPTTVSWLDYHGDGYSHDLGVWFPLNTL